MSRTFVGMLALLLAALAVVWGPAAPASACECVPNTTAGYFDRADVVFTGTLAARVPSPSGGPTSATGDSVLLVFAVDTVVKGEAAQRQGIVSPAWGSACGLEPSGDGPFVVFANRDATLPAGQYAASSCDGSRPLTEALEADLRRLGPQVGPSAQPRPGSAGVVPDGAGAEGAGPWPWVAGGATVLAALVLLWWLRRRQLLSGK